MKLPRKIGMLNRKCQFRCAHRRSFQANIKVNETKEYYLYIIYIHMISHVYITVICKWLFVFHEGVLTVKLVFFLLACFRLSRGKLEKRLETGAHVVVKTHEWTGLISPKTFDEAKELFSHSDWTGIWWRFFWICDMWSIRYDSKYSWLDSWTLIIMIVLGRFGDVTMGETKRFFFVKRPWWDLTQRRRFWRSCGGERQGELWCRSSLDEAQSWGLEMNPPNYRVAMVGVSVINFESRYSNMCPLKFGVHIPFSCTSTYFQ